MTRPCGRTVAALWGVVALGCAELPRPEAGVCGNRIVEASEACDNPDDDRCGGQQAGAAACRILCTPALGPEDCPPAHVCGDDGVCRAPSGLFSPEPIRIPEEGVLWLRAADLDGDGRAEVVGQFDQPDLKLFTFDGRAFAETIELQEQLAARVALADLTGDGRVDLFVAPQPPPDAADAAPHELGVWLSIGAATLGSQLGYFATLRTQGQGGRVVAPMATTERVLELVSATQTNRWSRTDLLATDAPPLGVGPLGLGRAIAIADLPGATCPVADGQPAVARRYLALATQGDDRVRIVSTCADDAAPVHLPDVVLPAGTTLSASGTFLVPQDPDQGPDGNLDLLVQGQGGATWVARGRGDGTFDDAGFETTPVLDPGDTDLGAVLTMGDYDADGALEIVTERAYVGQPGACAHDDCEIRPWDEAVQFAASLDANGDGALDIATLLDDVLTIHLATPGAATPFLSHAREVLGPSSELVVGDFNRDTVDDLAFVEVCEDPPGVAGAGITLMYGGPPQTWRFERLGPFVAVDSMAVEQASTVVARTVDAKGRPAGAYLQPGAAYYDFGFVAHQPATAATRGGPMVVALADRGDGMSPRLVCFGFSGGTLSPHDVVVGAPLGARTDPAQAVLVAADADGDGNDEAVVLYTAQGQGFAATAQWDPPTLQWRITQTHPQSVGFAAASVHPEVRDDGPPPGGGPGSVIATGDVDGDGDVDIVVTTDEPLPRVAVIENDAGTFAIDRIVMLNSVSRPGFEFAHVVAWHPDAQGKQRWLVAGNKGGIGVAEIDLRAGEIVLLQRIDVDTRALATGDIDGDGLSDFVAGTASDVRVYLAQPAAGGG